MCGSTHSRWVSWRLEYTDLALPAGGKRLNRPQALYSAHENGLLTRRERAPFFR